MSDARNPGVSGSPYRKTAPHAPTAIVRYVPAGPTTSAIHTLTAVFILFIWGSIVAAAWHDPGMTAPAWVVLTVVAASTLAGPVVMAMERVQRVHIEVDHGAGTLLLRTTRWPRQSRVRTFPLVRVIDAVVQDQDGLDESYMVFLVIEGELPVPLVEGLWTPAKQRHDKAAAAIRALLRGAAST